MEDQRCKGQAPLSGKEVVKREQLDQLRCEITVIPHRQYNHAARAIDLAEKLLIERDNVIAFAKQLLLKARLSEKEALSQIFSKLHGGEGHLTQEEYRKPGGPYEAFR